MMGQDHAQVQQHIGNGAPLGVGIATIVGVHDLIDFMADFERRNG